MDLLTNLLDSMQTEKLENASKGNKKINSYHPQRKERGAISLKKVKSFLPKLTLTEDADISMAVADRFEVFQSYGGALFCVWADSTNSLTIYNLEEARAQFYVDSAHTDSIISLKHYFDPVCNKDFFSSSSKDKAVKVWEISENNFQLVLQLNQPHGDKHCLVYSHFLFNFNNFVDVLLTTSYFDTKIKLWKLKDGKLLLEKDNTDKIVYVTRAEDKQGEYLIVCGLCLVKSYRLVKEELKDYKSYMGKPVDSHNCAFLNVDGELIESGTSGTVRVWDFHEGSLLRKFDFQRISSSFCVFNETFLLTAGFDKGIYLYDTSSGSFETKLDNLRETCSSLKLFSHPNKGLCLLTHTSSGELVLWN